MSISSLEP
jgi:hypothetical protein